MAYNGEAHAKRQRTDMDSGNHRVSTNILFIIFPQIIIHLALQFYI